MVLEKFDKIDQEEAMRIHDLGAEIAEIDRLTMIEEREEKAEARGVAKVAVQMLQEGYAISSISKVTGLSEAEINRLKNGS